MRAVDRASRRSIGSGWKSARPPPALIAVAAFVAGNQADGDGAQALSYAQRLLALDPWSEEAHRQVMLLLARSGRFSDALKQYGVCRQVLRSELGVAPSAETARLYTRIPIAFASEAGLEENAPVRGRRLYGFVKTQCATVSDVAIHTSELEATASARAPVRGAEPCIPTGCPMRGRNEHHRTRPSNRARPRCGRSCTRRRTERPKNYLAKRASSWYRCHSHFSRYTDTSDIAN